MSTLLQPANHSERMRSIDTIRGIAVLGILLLNIVGMGLPFAYSDPSISGGAEGWNLRVWFATELLFEGTFRGLFTMLFGSGFILFVSRMEGKGVGLVVADIYYRRTLWLILFGVIHAYLLLWYGEVLYVYGIFGLMLFPLRNIKPWRLAAAAGVLLTMGAMWNVLDYREIKEIKDKGTSALALQAAGDSLGTEQLANITAWEEKVQKHSPERIARAIEERQQGYIPNVLSNAPVVKYFQTSLMYELWVWDVLGYMLLGMALFKWGIFQGLRRRRFYLLLMLAGYGAGVSLNYWETLQKINSNFDPAVLAQADQTYQLGRLLVTLGHVGFFMLFIRSGVLGWLQHALAAVGKMALTNYLTHSVVAIFVFTGVGFGLFGKLQRYELYYVVGAIWVFQLLFSTVWMRYFRFGPAEWVWRSLTYKKRQGMRYE